MKISKTSIKLIVSSNLLLKKVKYFVLFALFISSANIFSQSKTIKIGHLADDYYMDMVSHNGVNYVLADITTRFDTILHMADSNFKLNCFLPAVLAFDDNFNLLKYYCIESGINLYPTIYGPGKIKYDSINHSIYIAATFLNSLVFGNDTLSSISSSVFIARLDTNLNPIWGRSSECNNQQNFQNMEIDGMDLDGLGRVWISFKIEGSSERACFNNTFVYNHANLVVDKQGVITISNIYTPSALKPIQSIKSLTNKKLLNISTNLMQLVNTDADTVIWEKSIPMKNEKRYIATDPENGYFYVMGSSDSSQLVKYDFNGNKIWNKNIPYLKQALGLDITSGGEKIYINGFEDPYIHGIYVINNNGILLENSRWGRKLDSNSIYPVYPEFSTLRVDGNKLKLFCTISNDSIVFGKDTIYKNSNSLDIYLSIIDINTIFTSLNKHVDLKNPFKVYPIPFNDFINIEGNQKIDDVEMYNLKGQPVKISNSTNFNAIYFPQDLEQGIYLLRVLSKNQQYVLKVVK